MERIKTRFDKWALDNEDMKAIQTIIPELNENEDERIRQALIRFFKNTHNWVNLKYDGDEIVAYLEKQKEPKPAEWSEEDEGKLKKVIATVQCAGNRVNNNATNIGLINWLQDRLKSLRPQTHWKPSKEQMEALNTLLCVGDFSYVGQAPKLQELYIDLKKLM